MATIAWDITGQIPQQTVVGRKPAPYVLVGHADRTLVKTFACEFSPAGLGRYTMADQMLVKRIDPDEVEHIAVIEIEEV